MPNSKPFTESTSADSTILGFDYQFFFFLYKLLELKENEVIGLEVKDDVHITSKNGSTILFQLKHSIQTNTNGITKNLTTLDSDLWKTLSNWCNVITDKNDGRREKSQQLKYINDHEFILITNKSISLSNSFITTHNNYKNKVTNFENFMNHLSKIQSSTKDETISKYIDNIISLDRDCCEKFLDKITVTLDFDDLIEKILNCLKTKMISEEKLNDVLESLVGAIKLDNFIELKHGNKYEITFQQFYTKYRNIFVKFRNKFNKVKLDPILPKELFEQNFIYRLLEIEAIENGNIDDATEETINKLRLENSLMHWFQIGDVMQDEIDDFHTDNLQLCKNTFKFAFKRNSTEEEIINIAQEKYSELIKKKFKIIDTELDYNLSNGELHSLSDQKLIGWHKDWKTK